MNDERVHVEELLPWYLNGTLEEAERREVEGHLERCEVCVRELDALEEIRVQVRLSGPPPSDEATAGPPIEAIWDRIGEVSTPGEPWLSREALRVLVAGQAAAILVLVVLLVGSGSGVDRSAAVPDPSPSNAGSFRTLSSPAHAPLAAERIRLVLRNQVSELEMRQLLLAFGVEIVAGPNEAGAYLLSPRVREGALRQEELIPRLRGDPRVLLAEPVGLPVGGQSLP